MINDSILFVVSSNYYPLLKFNGVNNVEPNGIEYVKTKITFVGPAGQNKRKLEGEKEL